MQSRSVRLFGLFSGNDRINCINIGLFIFLPKFLIGLFDFGLFGFSLGLFGVGFRSSVFLPTPTHESIYDVNATLAALSNPLPLTP
jgi:hypothetical protein